jgi:hypothetical protein
MKESEESNDNVMEDSKGLLRLPWAFSCLPLTAVPGLRACNSEERLAGSNDVSFILFKKKHVLRAHLRATMLA